MADQTNIEWCDATFNPWIGCLAISPGCANCYAAAWAKRYGRDFAERTRTKTWAQPLRWNAAHAEFFAEHGRRQRVFCASLADVFDNAVPIEWRSDLFDLIRTTPNLDWLLLTKRIGNVHKMLEDVYRYRMEDHFDMPAVEWIQGWLEGSPPGNVWLGATIVNQEEADRDIPKLLAVPVRVRFLSMEPLLGPINLADISDGHADSTIPREYWVDGLDTEDNPPGVGHNALTGERWQRFGEWQNHGSRIDWVIAGGESGPGARPMHPDWATLLRDQCGAAGVPFLYKQWGEWVPMMGHAEGIPVTGPKFIHSDGTIMGRAGKKAAGRELDGVTHDGFPDVTYEAFSKCEG